MNLAKELEIVLKILNISENNQDLVNRFMFGSVLMLEYLRTM